MILLRELNKINDTKTAENLRNKLNRKINDINNLEDNKNIFYASNNNPETSLNLLDIKDIRPGAIAFIESF